MIVKIEFVEMIWDNYQGASGKPIVRSMLIETPSGMKICDVENMVLQALTEKGIQGDYNPAAKSFPPERLIKIEILPTLHLNKP